MFNGVRIGVGFQPEPQLAFRYTTVNVKLGFMVVSLSTTPSRRLITKSRLWCNTHALQQ
jgi:hypothetical protein